MKIGDCSPVKASEEVWRIRSRTWDPDLKFSKAHRTGKIGHHVMSRMQLASLTVPAEVVVLATDTFVSEERQFQCWESRFEMVLGAL